MSKSITLPGLKEPVDIYSPIIKNGNFTWAEATMNGSRIPVQTNFWGITIAASQITANIIRIATDLEKIRSNFGDRPITVNSWYRPPRVNRAVGGVADSQHLLGWAVDIKIKGYKPSEVAEELSNYWLGGLGDSSTFTHIDRRDLMGLRSARWDYGNA
jgi:hypothetical protein